MQILLRRIRTVHCLELVLYEKEIQIVRQSLGIIGRPSLFIFSLHIEMRILSVLTRNRVLEIINF